MIGSPDLLAFTGTEGFGDGEKEDPEPLDPPEELWGPLLPPAHPWRTSARFNRDFILVAEFSEQVGPRPVLTIPDDPAVIGSFDLNHFSVRIMSVDYQALGPAHAPPASPGLHLSFSEDSEVILGDSGDDAFAYVRHVTLYDLQARGLVRPFCVAYVCSEQLKLTENFAELSASFSQASDSLKTGNRQAFSTELQRKLQELESRRLSLLPEGEHARMENGFTPAGENNVDELEAVESSIFNHRELLRQVTSYPNRKRKQPNFLPYDPAGFISDPNALLLPEPCQPLPSSTSCRSQRRLKPLRELCNPYFLSLMKEQLANTERRLRGDRSVLRTARIAQSLSRKLTLVNFLFERWSPEDEDEEERASGEAELQGETERRSGGGGGESFPFDPKSLESFWSCVEGIPIKLEAGGGAWTGTPGVAMEMTGSVSSSDSIEVLGTEKSYRTQEAADGRETSAGTTADWRAAGDVSARRVRAYARRTNSEDSIEVLSTTGSIVADDLAAITEEEEAERRPPGDGLGDEGGILGEDVTSEGTSADEDEIGRPAREEDGGRLDARVSLKPAPVNGEVSNQGGGGERLKTQQVREENVDPPLTLAEEDRWPPPCSPPPCSPLRLPSVDEASDRTSLTGSSHPPSPTPTQSILSSNPYSAQQRRRRRRKAALRALRFLKQNSFSQHAVFCLLSGQPLVVVGGAERSVQKLVEALSLFLPAPDGGAVMLSLTRPLQVSDLLTWRLIGIHRSPSGSLTSILHSLTRYSRYLALLDLDQRTLRCPSHCGSLTGRLADPHTGIGRGATYLLHLESCLTALANRALLHTFCPAALHPKATGGKDGTEEEEEEEEERVPPTRGFCSSSSSSETDLRVMRFLSDLIKRRHAGRGPPVLRFSYCSMQLHRNTCNTTAG